jgi:glycosyltransferase involved in cell wall biosynthesis
VSDADHPRVLVVAPLYHPDRGGLGRQAVLVTEAVARAGARPWVATRRMEGLPPHVSAVPVVRLQAGRPRVHNYERKSLRNLLTSLRFSAKLVGTLLRRRDEVDVLHFHGASLPLVLALPWARLLGKPVVAKVAAVGQGVEAGDLSGRYGPLGRLLAWELRHVDTFVATTEEIAQALRADGVPPEQVVRLPNVVETDRFHPPSAEERTEARRALGLAPQAPAVVCSARLVRRKAVDVLIHAFAQVQRRDPSAVLLILGDGPEAPTLQALAASLDLTGSVRFLGFRRDPERVLWAGDLLCLPSEVEGLPNALLEGLACGLPAVASRLGGVAEVLGQGPDACGLLVPPREAAPLAEALSGLLEDPELRAAFARRASARVAAGFTLGAVAPAYLDLYRRLAQA